MCRVYVWFIAPGQIVVDESSEDPSQKTRLNLVGPYVSGPFVHDLADKMAVAFATRSDVARVEVRN